MKKYLIALFLLFSSACHAENIDKKIIEEKIIFVREKLKKIINQNPALETDEMIWFHGYIDALEYVISIID